MHIDAIFLTTGRKLDGTQIIVLPQGTFIRDGADGYYMIPAHAVASVHFKGTKAEIDKMFTEGKKNEADKIPTD